MSLDTKPCWADVVLTAESLRDPFDMVQIVSSKAAFRTALRTQALEKIDAVKAPHNEHTIRAVELALVNRRTVFVRESITFDDDGIHAVINDKYNVNDEATMCRVMDMISAAVDQLPNKKGTLEFGELIQYTIPQMPHLLQV